MVGRYASRDALAIMSCDAAHTRRFRPRQRIAEQLGLASEQCLAGRNLACAQRQKSRSAVAGAGHGSCRLKVATSAMAAGSVSSVSQDARLANLAHCMYPYLLPVHRPMTKRQIFSAPIDLGPALEG